MRSLPAVSILFSFFLSKYDDEKKYFLLKRLLLYDRQRGEGKGGELERARLERVGLAPGESKQSEARCER